MPANAIQNLISVAKLVCELNRLPKTYILRKSEMHVYKFKFVQTNESTIHGFWTEKNQWPPLVHYFSDRSRSICSQHKTTSIPFGHLDYNYKAATLDIL